MPSQSAKNKSASQARRDALLRLCSDSSTASTISKSLSSIIQSSENALFRRTCVEMIRRWGSSNRSGAPSDLPTSFRASIGKPIANEVLVQLHRTFVGDVKRND